MLVTLALSISWLAWLAAYYPGIIGRDTLFAIAQTTGLAANISNHDPVLDSWIFGAAYEFGRDVLGAPSRGLFIMCVAQCVLLALECGTALVLMERRGLPRVLSVGVGLSLALLPTFPILALFASKDTLYTLLFLPFAAIYIECVRTRGALLVRPFFIGALLFLALGMALTKKTGLVVCAPCLLALLLLCKYNRTRMGVGLLGLLAIMFVWTTVLIPALGISKGHAREALSLPAQQIARVVAYEPEALTDADWKAVNTYFGDESTSGYPDALYSTQRVAELYNPHHADPIKENLSNHALENDMTGFICLWTSLGSKRPVAFIDAYIDLYEPFFVPTRSMYGYPDLFNEYLVDEAFYRHYPYYASLRDFQWQPGFSEVDMKNFALTLAYDTPSKTKREVLSLFETIDGLWPARALVWGSLIPVWLTLGITIAALIISGKGQRGKACAYALPWLLSLAIVLIGPVVWVRYFEPLYFAMPLLFTWFFAVLNSSRFQKSACKQGSNEG